MNAMLNEAIRRVLLNEQTERILKHAERALEELEQANEIVNELSNTQAIDYHVSSALSHGMDRPMFPLAELIEYLKGLSK